MTNDTALALKWATARIKPEDGRCILFSGAVEADGVIIPTSEMHLTADDVSRLFHAMFCEEQSK